jgi:hypothetical protein
VKKKTHAEDDENNSFDKSESKLYQLKIKVNKKKAVKCKHTNRPLYSCGQCKSFLPKDVVFIDLKIVVNLTAINLKEN